MKAPEWILSTPRLILVMMTVWLLVFTYNGITPQEVFKDLALVIFGYFFWSRWSETPKQEPGTVTLTDTTAVPAEDLSLSKLEAYDTSNQQ